VALSLWLRPARHGRVVHRRWRQHRPVQRTAGVVRRRGRPDKHIILVLDGAGWHVARDLVVPEGVELMFLPPYSPQIQPAERLWPLTNEPIVNEYFETLEELDEVLAERCRILADDPDQIKAHTLFEWWPHHN
jgi:transposase